MEEQIEVLALPNVAKLAEYRGLRRVQALAGGLELAGRGG
jgi:hypothetical protein